MSSTTTNHQRNNDCNHQNCIFVLKICITMAAPPLPPATTRTDSSSSTDSVTAMESTPPSPSSDSPLTFLATSTRNSHSNLKPVRRSPTASTPARDLSGRSDSPSMPAKHAFRHHLPLPPLSVLLRPTVLRPYATAARSAATETTNWWRSLISAVYVAIVGRGSCRE